MTTFPPSRAHRGVLGVAMGALVALPATAASHREAPLTALDQKADITDYYAFVSYDDPNRVTLILDVDPDEAGCTGTCPID